ncbi:hypothetical protein BKA70DRAFT_1350028 [Coprinopsis sp. MPI-PUGE-AT-0042]|nr:hypothetical protein BKA70DRAFT_1350028 [Coprinopsis sp. MPI-PUGE-AT-0042]
MSSTNTGDDAIDAPLDLTFGLNAQSASPVFTVLPPELRAEIFSLALASFPDTSSPYQFGSYWYRPGYTAPKRADLSLLLTCKSIYQEAKDLVWQKGGGNDDEAFWWGSDKRRPLEYGGREGSLYSDPSLYYDHDDMWGDGDPSADDSNDELDEYGDLEDHDSEDGPTWQVDDDVVEEDLDEDLENDGLEDEPIWGMPDDESAEELDEGFGQDDLEDEELGDGFMENDDFSGEIDYEPGEESDEEPEHEDYGDEYPSDEEPEPEYYEYEYPSDDNYDVSVEESYGDFGYGESDNEGGAALQEEEEPHNAVPLSREDHVDHFLNHSLANVKEWHSDRPLQSERQKAFKSNQWSRIRSIHIFPQMYAFSSKAFTRTFIQAEGLRPRTVKVTIRYTDWWNWESKAALDLVSIIPELDAYYFPESVDTFIIELETAEHKKKELEGMVKQVVEGKQTWRWKRLDDEHLEFDEDVGEKFAHHPKGDTMKYIVKVLTFTAKPTQVEWDGTPFDRALAIKDYEASLKPS